MFRCKVFGLTIYRSNVNQLKRVVVILHYKTRNEGYAYTIQLSNAGYLKREERVIICWSTSK
jgi:hypothetical protein